MPRRALSVVTAAALSLGAGTAVQAQSSVSAYGLMDMSVGQYQATGSSTKLWRAQSGNMTTSFLGFKGTEDLGGGLKAVFSFEHFLRLDTGEPGRFNGDAFWARSAWVGLSGAFGTSKLGRNTTPLFVSTLIFNAIGDSFGYSPSIRQLFTPNTGAGMLPFFGDTGWNSSLAYNSPNFNGLSLNLIGNLGEGSATANGRNIGANVLYFRGPFAATVAAQQVKNGAFGVPAGWASQDTVQLGLSYDLSVVKLFGQYTLAKTKATLNTDTAIYGLGAAVPVGAGKVLLQYGNATADRGATEVVNKTLTVGYDYFLSKSTDVYAVIVNDKATGLDAGNSVAAGLRVRF
ncbi:MAG: porin [Methylibium sp. NZG]|nr:MAG: porin [Methylibium sp. NZG]